MIRNKFNFIICAFARRKLAIGIDIGIIEYMKRNLVL